MQATTGNLPKVMVKELKDLSKQGAIIACIIIFAGILISLFGDNLHRLLDSKYRAELEKEEAATKTFNENFEKLRQHSKP